MYCDTYHCELSEAACAKRHRLANGSPKAGPVEKHLYGDIGCASCATGRRLAACPAQTNRMKIKMSETQTKYGPAAKTAVCKKCGAEKDLKKNFYKMTRLKSGYDATCKKCRIAQNLARQHKMQQAARRDQEARQAGSAGGNWRAALFAGRPELEAAIEILAERELRTFDNQVIYMLQMAAAERMLQMAAAERRAHG